MVDKVALIESNKSTAKMSIFLNPAPNRPSGSRYYIFGADDAPVNFTVTARTFLPKIDIPAIFRAMTLGGAKHATFTSKGNQFSRIAHLVRSGYAALNSGSLPQGSGVLFRWNERDLHAYAKKWKAAENATGDSEAEEAYRFSHLHNNMIVSYYFFKNDEEVVKRSGREVTAELKALEEESMAGRMVYF